MAKIPMGMAHIYYDTDTGDNEFRKSSLRTVEGDFSGRPALRDPDEPDFGDEDDDEGDEGGDEDEDGDEDDDNGDDDSGDESGASRRRKRRKARAAARKKKRLNRKNAKTGNRKERNSVEKVSSVETLTSQTPTIAGQEMTIEFRADELFVVERLTFSGDDDARLKSIFIGRKAIFNSSNGTRLSEFKSTNLQTLQMKGTQIPRGAYIRIKVESSAALAAIDANLYGVYHEKRGC